MKLVYKNEGEEKSLTLGKEAVTIGRSENNVIYLNDNSCSRNHCLIEYRDKNYQIVDLRSFNGIKVNGEKVNSHVLQHGDVVTVGKTVMKIEDNYLFANDCSVTATHVRKIQNDSFFTELSKWREIPYATPFVVGLLTLFFISLTLRFRENYDFYQVSVAKYKEILAQDLDSKVAITKFEEIAEIVQGTSLAKTIELTIERLKQKNTYYSNANSTLYSARKSYQTRDYSPQKYIYVLEDLSKIYKEPEIYTVIRAELVKAKNDYEAEIAGVFDGVKNSAQQKMEQGNFQAGLKYYHNFNKDYPLKHWRDKVEFEITKMYALQREDWVAFNQKIDFLQSKNRLLEARMLVLMKYENYLNTPLANEAHSLLTTLQKMKTQEIAVVKPKQNTYIPNISNFLDQYDVKKLIKNDKWNEVIKKLAGLREKTRNGKTRKIIQEYARDFKSLARLQQNFFASWKSIEDLYIPIANKEAVIRNIENKTLVLGLRGEIGTIHFKWGSLPAAVKLSALQKLPFDEESGFGLASLCMVSGLEEEVHAVLISILDNIPSAKNKVDRFFSRWTGVEIPKSKGFIVFRDLLIHPKEKLLVEYREEIKDFSRAQVVKPNKYFASELQKIHNKVKRVSDLEIKDTLLIALGENLFATRKQLMRKIQNSFDFAAVKYLQQLKTELEKRRKHALALIFDEKTYPADETKGAAAQPDVDKRVAAVREIWETPSKGIEKLSPRILKSKKIILQIDTFLKKEYSGMYEVPREDRLESLNSFIDGRLDIKNYAESPQENQRIRDSKIVMEENNSGTNDATSTERRQVEITNAYRHMMGRSAVKINSSLAIAARKHSGYLRANKIFAHNVPGEPEGATPAQRARTAGYTGRGVGENIYMGRTSPQEAHNGWVHSAGHHRNILNLMWRAMGSGQSSNYWTQKFGSQ
ncbi:FHA domain-containing protein [Candidatus Uabimicrobium sp. HlEnr_7]|uniref:FHA domain-containing protein n=1 Tax=Candidatus Uabimicrobium helgolandensis TaxID=3095367 RepID=UPI00355621B4